MTACRNKARGAVVAALAGALTLGAAPVMALADGASLMATDEAAVQRGEVAYWTEIADEYTYTGLGLGPVPKTITPVGEDTEDVVSILPKTGRVEGTYYYYYVDLDGQSGEYGGDYNAPAGVSYTNDKGKDVPLTGKQVRDDAENLVTPTRAGRYAVVVCQLLDGNLVYVDTADTFKIVGQPLDSAVLCDGEDATDTEFNYDGAENSTTYDAIVERIHATLDGQVLTDSEVEITLWDQGGKNKLTGSGTHDKVGIGTKYIVKITGVAGSAFEGQEVEREFTLGKMDLSDAVVLGNVLTTRPNKGTAASDAVKSINGVENLDWGGIAPNGAGITFTYESNPNGSQTSADDVKGDYTFTLAATADNPNVTGSVEVTVPYADYEATVDFGNDGIEQGDGSFLVDLSADKVTAFDTDEIEVSFSYTSGTKVTAEEGDGYTVSVTDDEGNAVDDMSAPGTYYVRVDAAWEYNNSSNKQLYIAGSEVAKVVVKYAIVGHDDVFLSYKNENVELLVGDADDYCGEDLSQHFKATVKVANGTVLTQGEDYTVTFQRVGFDGRVSDVEQIVDAGLYRVVIKGVTFGESYAFTFVVRPIILGSDEVSVVAPYDVDGTPAFGYSGEVIVPEYTYLSGDDKVTLDPSLYKAEYVADPDGDGKGERGELKDADEYVAHLTTAEGVTNYVIDATLNIVVTETKVFADVPNNEWYSEPVYDAAKLGYMTGYGDTKFFGPADSIKRGDVAVVLYKMAGLYTDDTHTGHPGTGYETPFSDVDMNDYWAEAIQWAAKLGIVSGDGGADTFRPNDPVTREELAKMLYRFMELQGKTGDVDVDAVLGAYEDESSVSDWARTYVAWLVEQEVMGQNSGLEGNKAISRAEVAAMTVRLQPEGKLNGDEFLDPTPQPEDWPVA